MKNPTTTSVMAGKGYTTENALERRRIIREAFRDNFVVQLEKSGRSQKDVAEQAGIAEYEMSRYARAAQTPKPGKVEAIAKALGVSPDALVPGYVSTSDATGLSVTMQELDTGHVWIEFQGAFDRDTANEMISIMSKNKVARKAA